MKIKIMVAQGGTKRAQLIAFLEKRLAAVGVAVETSATDPNLSAARAKTVEELASDIKSAAGVWISDRKN